MNLLEAIVLGLIQGFTEFLPVSSSGHLELSKYLFGIDHEANFYFSIAVHGATVLSTLFVLWKEIAGLIKGFFAFRFNDETRYIIKLIISMIPILIVGFIWYDIVLKSFTGSMIPLGIHFMITSVLLGLTLFIKPKERAMTYFDSFIIGLAQAVAVLPGISRSGATIATGMMLGNKKSDIAKFSFLMVLIPIIGANILEATGGEFTKEGTSLLIILVGFLTAFISGYLACKWMISIVKKGNLKWFAIYCFLMGVFSIILGLHVF
jgi:undecaprenyl-diphosphatase